MKANRTIAAMIGLAGIVTAGVAWNSAARAQQGGEAGNSAGDAQSLSQQGAGDGRRVFFPWHVTDRGNKRMIVLIKALGSSTGGANVFTAPYELDVSQIVISNGTWASNGASSFGFQLQSSNQVPFFSASSGEFGTKTITFPVPLEIREGDRISYGYYSIPGETFAGRIEMTLIGTVPTAGVDSFSVR